MSQQRIGIHRDIIELITSEEADEVTPLMDRIYYRLLIAPPEWWESSETLRVKGSMREEVWSAAWAELVRWLRVAPWDARKAIEWLEEKKVIDYQGDQVGLGIKITFEGIYFPE